MHRLLKRQIERLGLDAGTPPDMGLWRQLLEHISAFYTHSDEARHLSERSLEISSRGMHELHEKARNASESLEERVEERTAELKRAELAARASEARFRSLTELSSDVYWEQDREYRFTAFSGTGTERVNPANMPWIGRRRWEQNYINMSAADWAAHIAALDARQPFRDLELCRLTDSGERVWTTVSGEPVFDAAGAFEGYRGVGRDITARKHTEALQALEHAVTRSLAEADDASSTLKAVIRAVCEALNWECGRYWRVDEQAGVLRVSESWSVPDPAIEQFIAGKREVELGSGVGLAGRAWQSGEPTWIADVSDDAHALQSGITREAGLHGAFHFPVLAEGRTIGVMAFNSRRIQEPDERLLQAARVIGSQIGQFLQRKQAQQVMRESEERFRATFEQAAVGISRVDLAGVLMDVNQRFCDMLGYSKVELLGKHVRDITHPDDFGKGSQYRAQLAQHEMKSAAGEKRFLRKDGSVLWARRTMSTAHDAAGKPLYVISVVEDITERKQAEERYRATFDNAPVGIMHTAVDDDSILHANAKLCEMLGYPYDELVRMKTDQFIHPDYVGADQPKYRERMLKGEVDTFSSDRLYRRRDGSDFWVNRTVSLARDSTGSPLYFIRIVEDITERKELERRYRETFDQAAVGIVHTSADGRYLRVNQKFCGMLGYSESELVGRLAADFTHPDDRDKTRESRQLLWDGKLDKIVEEKRYFRKDGSVVWSNRTVSLARDAMGRPDYFIRVVEDITERKAAEERYRATFDNAPVGIMHTTVDGYRILRANSKLCEMLGYTQDELLRMTSTEVVHPDYRFSDKSSYVDQMLNGEIQSFASERQFVRKDGSSLWVNRTVSLVRDASGEPLYFIRVIEDITERTLSARRRAIEHAVTQALAESATVEDAMPIVLRTVCQALEWTCGAHWNWSETEELLRCGATWHVNVEGVADFVDATRESPNEAPAWRGAAPGTSTGGVVRRVWFSGEPAWFADVMQHPDFRRGPAAARAGLHSAFGFPILAGAQPLGVMEFYSREIKQPDEALLQMVRAIGSQIGQFIQRKRAEDKVAQLAQFDTVTGLPNRSLFNDRLGQMLTQAQRNNWSVAVLFLDLDRFKAVNDTYGHAAGDVLLRQVAGRLKECVRSGDTVGRLSGDEFAVVLSNLAKADDAGLVAQKVVDALAAPFDLDGHQSYISASIGIALFPSDGREPDELIKNADTAMYRAKEQGRNGYQFYLPQMNERLTQRLQLEAQLRGALERDEFRLHYQPKVDLKTGAISGFEALLRWQHGERLVSPAEFIPILEYTGLIVPVGEWVVRSACGQIKRWEEQGLAARPVAVNLSARQFQRRNLAEVIGAIVREAGIDPGLLEFELTETLLMSDAEEAVQTLRELKALGVRLAVDDFGTGYSSLTYLKRFPLDTLKIDRTFIRDAVSDPDDAAITLTMISLAHSLKLKVVAEGVETEGQLSFLRSHGCDEMQGYYFARPMPAEACSQALVEDRRLPSPERHDARDVPILLLVDDNENDLTLLKRTFGAEGFHVLAAAGPADGFECLARHGADVVVSDHNLSGMTGIEFLTKVRKLYPETVRVIVTGGDAPTLTRAVNAAGIHRFLFKTWDRERLCSEVREAYQQRHKKGLVTGIG